MPIKTNAARTSLRLQNLTEWDVTSVKSALKSLEFGDARRAGMLADAMMRDDRIGAVMETRINGILGLKINVTPADGVPASENAAGILQAKDSAYYRRILPEDSIREIMRYGLLINMMPIEIVWDTGDVWSPVITPWHPQFVEFDWETREFWVRTDDGRESINNPDSPFVMFSPLGRHRPYMQGLIRRLAIPYLIRTWAMRDWSRWSEKHGLPATKAFVPSGANAADREAFFQDIIGLNQESVIELPFTVDPTTGNRVSGFDVEMLEAASQSWDGFNALWERIDMAIAISLLGQNLTTQVEGGSLAAANAHERIRRDYLLADVETLQSLEHESIWVPWYELNFGEPGDTPMIARDTSPKPVEQGIENHHIAAGIFTKNELRARFGEEAWPAEMGGDDVVGGSAPGTDPVMDRPSVDLPNLGRDDDDAEDGESNNPSERVKQAALAGLTGSAKEAQTALDAREDADAAAVSKGLRPSVDALLRAVERAGTYEQLRAGILETFGSNPPSAEVAKALARSMILAEMIGKRSALAENT